MSLFGLKVVASDLARERRTEFKVATWATRDKKRRNWRVLRVEIDRPGGKDMNKQQKPVVHFIKGTAYRETLDDIVWFSHVYALDHPRLGRDVIRTSRVVKEFDDGSFETLNSIYVPVEGEYNEVVSD